MSYLLFKAELLASLVPPHQSKTKQARVLANAYTNLVQRHFEILTGAGTVQLPQARAPILQAGLQAVFTTNRLYGKVPVNIFTQMAPFFMAYWTGQVVVGPLGVATVLFPGIFRGPAVKPNLSYMTWINILCAVLAAHIMTLGGIYVNNYTGLTFPWSGVMFLACPILF